MQMGEFKQEILRINNKVNMEVFNQGLLSQRVDVLREKVLITAKNRRLNMFSISTTMDKSTTEIMERVLIIRFKERFIEEVERDLGLKVLAHLKDYDAGLELSASLSIFERPIEELLPDIKVSK